MGGISASYGVFKFKKRPSVERRQPSQAAGEPAAGRVGTQGRPRTVAPGVHWLSTCMTVTSRLH